MQSPWGSPPHAPAPQHAPVAPVAQASAPPPVSVMAAVRFVFQSPDWKTNLLFAMLLSLIPIAGPLALAGWLAEMHQRLVRRHPQPIAKFEFDDFVHYLTRGLPVFLVTLVAMLPIGFVVGIVSMVAVFGGVLVGAGTGEQLLIIVAVSVGATFFTVACWLVFSVFLNAAQTRAELTEDFGQALNLGKMGEYARATWKHALVKNIVFALVAFGLVLLGMLLCYIGMYPAIALIQIAAAHLRWQIYEQYLAQGREPIPLKAPQWLPSEVQRQQRGY